MFTYNCEVTYIVDGDTCDVKIDLGFNIFHTARVRLYGINAPESRTRDKEEKYRGLQAKSRRTLQMIPRITNILLKIGCGPF